jgi:mono/diheme cytochrome c family protein
MRRRMTTRKIASLGVAAAVALGATACGTRNLDLDKQDQANTQSPTHKGAQLFQERCSGCHTINAAGAQGSKPTNDHGSGERTNGPNFNIRKESRDDILFAIRNGGFSGAIMPANVAVGSDAQDIATFLSKYAGRGGSDVSENTSPPGR